MNFTLLSLQLSWFGAPGSFFSRSVENFAMKNSRFKYAYSPLFHFSRFRNIGFDSTTFANTLSRPITIHAEEFRKLSFNETSNFSDQSVSFVRCLFINLSSDSFGGAIYATSNEEACSVVVNNSGFSHCSAEAGGAIYVSKLSELTMEHVCFSDCISNTGDSSAFYGHTGEVVQTSWVSIVGGGAELNEDSRAVYVRSVKSFSRFLNISSNSQAITWYANSFFCEMLFTHINQVNAVTHLHLRHMANMVKFYDVVNCTLRDNSALFTLNGTKLSLFNGIFVNVKAKKCVHFGTEPGSTCRFQDCTFNGCNMEHEWGLITSRRVSFDVENATLFSPVMMNTDYCWYGQATWDIANIHFQVSGASVAFSVICLCVFVMYCFLKGKLAETGNLEKESDRRRSSDWSGKEEEGEELGIDEDLEAAQTDQNEPMAAITAAVTTETNEKPKEKTYQ